MKAKRIILKGPSQVALASEIIGRVDLDGSTEVLIRDYHRDRSYEQNRLLWKFYGIISDGTGETREGIHLAFKRQILVRILARDDPAFYRLSQVVRNGGDESDKVAFANMISTTRLSVKQMSEMLNEIIKEAGNLGIMLTDTG